jgi:hypothetical protein
MTTTPSPLLLIAFLFELRDLDLDRECLDDLAGGGRDSGCADDRRNRGEDTTDPLRVDSNLACRIEVQQNETGGASTAASAAIRTSIRVSTSRLAIESAVMRASRSRTGASFVDSVMVLPFVQRCPQNSPSYDPIPEAQPAASPRSSESDKTGAVAPPTLTRSANHLI